MNTKKAIIISLLGSIAYFLVGWLAFDLILGEYTSTNTTNIEGFKKNEEEYSVLFLYISCLAYSILITYILLFLNKTHNPLHGFIKASVIGVLIAIMTDTYWYGSSNFYNNILVMFMDILAAAITVGILGLVIVWLDNILSKEAKSK